MPLSVASLPTAVHPLLSREASRAPAETHTPAPTAPQAGDPAEEGEAGAPARLLTGLLAAAALLLALPLRRWAVLLLRARRLRGPDAGRAAIAAYRYCKRLEPWGAAMPEAVAELAKKARFSNHTLTRDEGDRAAEAALAAARTAYRALPGWKRLVFRWVLALG